MTDLIARLEKRLDYHIGHDEKNCTETVTLADFPAILHALKVQQAAEDACREMTWAEFIGIKWPALVAAVKGEQG